MGSGRWSEISRVDSIPLRGSPKIIVNKMLSKITVLVALFAATYGKYNLQLANN